MKNCGLKSDLIRSVTNKSDDCDEKCIKIKLDSDDKLRLNKAIEIPVMIIVVRAIFYENKYYSQVSFSMNVCMKYKKCYIMIELTFLKELMLLKQVHQKSGMFVNIGIS